MKVHKNDAVVVHFSNGKSLKVQASYDLTEVPVDVRKQVLESIAKSLSVEVRIDNLQYHDSVFTQLPWEQESLHFG